MPKNFVRESIRHHVLRALERTRRCASAQENATWDQVCATCDLVRREDGSLAVTWVRPRPGLVPVNRARFELYRRGDLPEKAPTEDPATSNEGAADAVAAAIATELGLAWCTTPLEERLWQEEEFHDRWAAQVGTEAVMVRESFEACTAPEHRFIARILGDVEGKRLLDVGSGLGEASVYFTLKGAKVTACDLSDGMLQMVSRVAERHAVTLALHRASAEDTGLPDDAFDIVYAGNLLHHVNLPKALDEIRRVLAPGGTFVTWDPLAHNPLINICRRMASAVRTSDEHPLRMSDLAHFRMRFRDVRWRCFWLFALTIFLRFYLWEHVHPSRERYWKKILTDASRLAPFYNRLAALDDRVLAVAPWLGRYCWNIVVWGTK